MTAPAPGSIVDASPTITGNVSDALSGVATLQARVDGGAATSVAVDASGHFNLPAKLAADGVHVVELSATDGAGNVATASLGFTLDTQPPTISVAAPAPGSIVDASPTITGSVSDALSGVATLQGAGRRRAATAVAVDASGHFSFPAGLARDGSADGTHTVELSAADRAGNVATTSLSFTLDTQAPTIQIRSPAGGLTTGADPTIAGTVSAAVAPLATLQAQVDGGAAAAVPFDATNGAFLFTPMLPMDGTADGSHTVQLSVTDAAGHGATTDFTFTLDTRAPTITVAGPRTGTTLAASPTLMGAVVDALSGVASSGAQADGGAERAVAVDGSGDFALPVGSIADGVHIVRCAATDGTGNVATTSQGSIRSIPSRRRRFRIPHRQFAGSIVDASPTITGSVSDVLSGGASLEAQVDGGAERAVAVDGSGEFTLPVGSIVDGAHIVRPAPPLDGRAAYVATTSLGFTARCSAADDFGGGPGRARPGSSTPARRSPAASATHSAASPRSRRRSTAARLPPSRSMPRDTSASRRAWLSTVAPTDRTLSSWSCRRPRRQRHDDRRPASRSTPRPRRSRSGHRPAA